MKFSKRKRHLMKINEERNRKGFAETLSTREGLVIRMKKLYTKLKKSFKKDILKQSKSHEESFKRFQGISKTIKNNNNSIHLFVS